MPSNWLMDSDYNESTYNLAAKQSPELANSVKKLTGLFAPETGSISMSLNGMQSNLKNGATELTGKPALDNVDLNTYTKLRYQYSNIYSNTVEKANAEKAAAEKANGGKTADTEGDRAVELNDISARLQETLKPVSSHMGSTIGNATGVLQSPLGPELAIPKTLQAMMRDTNPALAAKYDATYKKCTLDKLSEQPGSLLGSAQQIVRTSNSGQTIPMNFVTDIYHGAMGPMNSLKALIESITEILEMFFNNSLRTKIPGTDILLDSVVKFAGNLNGVSTMFSGLKQMNALTDQLQKYSGGLDRLTQNSFEYAAQYAPSQVLGGKYSFQNPSVLLNKFIPPNMQSGFAKLQDSSGFSFSGKMGVGLGGALQGLRGGVISGVVSGYATQFAMLAPLFTGSTPGAVPNIHPNETGTLEVPDGPTYNIEKTTGQIVRIKPPAPNYFAKV